MCLRLSYPSAGSAASVVLLLLLTGCPHLPPSAPPQPGYTGPIIDLHAHYLTENELESFGEGTPRIADLPMLMQRANVTKSALIVMARRGDLEANRALNDEVIAYAERSNGRFLAVGSVHPLDGEGAIAELKRIAARGVKIIKLHPNTQRFDVGAPEVAAVVAASAELNLVILFDGFSPFDADQNGKFAMLAIRNPKARLILAHFGGPKFDEVLQFGIIRQFPWYRRNVWFDLSAMAHVYADSPYEQQLVWVARQIGTDRILFGSDFPVETPAHAVEDLRRLGFTPAEEREIFHDNAAALLELARSVD